MATADRPLLQKFALQQLDRAAAAMPDAPIATVTGIASGAGTDGADVVTVTYLGASLQFAHMAHYTPAVGHVVTLKRVGGNWVIDGRPIGHPH